MEKTKLQNEAAASNHHRPTMEPSRIPEEVRALIVEHAVSNNGTYGEVLQATKTLLSLCLTSKNLQRLAQPLLFRRFSCRGRHAQRTLRLFLRSLLEAPRRLASTVQEVSLDSFACRSTYVNQPNEILESPPTDLAALYRSDLFPFFESGSPLCDAYVDLCRGLEDAETLLLLLLCPGIVDLHMISNSYFEDGNYVLDYLQRQWRSALGRAKSGASEKRVLSKLKRFHIEHYDPESTVDLKSVCSFLVLPHVQQLEGEMISVGIDYNDFKSNITEIRLRESLWETKQDFASFLRSFPNLGALELEAGGVCTGFCTSNFSAIGDCLRQFGTSIKRLRFDAREACFDEALSESSDSDETATLGNLKELKNLECLTIPIEHLFDLDWVDDASIEDIYDSLQNDILPDSCTEVIALSYFSSPGRPARPIKCKIYQGPDGTGKFKLHLCRESGSFVGDTCVKDPDYDENVAKLRSTGQQQLVAGDSEDEDGGDDDEE